MQEKNIRTLVCNGKYYLMILITLIANGSAIVSAQNLDSLINLINHAPSVDVIDKTRAMLPQYLSKVDLHMLGVIAEIDLEGIRRGNAAQSHLHQRFSSPGLQLNDSGGIHAEIYVKQGAHNYVELLNSLGARVEYVEENIGRITCYLPFDVVIDLSREDNVRAIRPIPTPIYYNVGQNGTAGDGLLKADIARSSFNISGQNVKVGVISDGCTDYATSQQTIDLPDNSHLSVRNIGSGNEGTAMMEIIHDLAPGANLVFDGGGLFLSEAGLISDINDLYSAGCNVIVDDVGLATEVGFQDGLVAAAVDNVTSNGVKYISSAGNNGMTVWEGHPVSDAGWVRFGTDPGDIFIPIYDNWTPNNTETFALQWANKNGTLPDVPDSYEIYFFTTQDVNSVPFTYVVDHTAGVPLVIAYVKGMLSPSNLYIAVRMRSVTTQPPPEIRLVAINLGENHQFGIQTNGGIFGHAAANSCISVAAIDAVNGNFIEDFSSHGPSRIYNYDSNGRPTTFIDRSTPTLSGVDNVNTYIGTSSGYWPIGNPTFKGTSAAAPHIAGAAALLLSLNSSLSWQQLEQSLTQTARQVDNSGYFPNPPLVYGSGLVDTYQAGLSSLAFANKSTTYCPASYNNEQPLVRSADGKIHEVFSSGGEIFYRRSSNRGSSWDITTRLSAGIGSNDCPSLAACYYSGATSLLEAVWQYQHSNPNVYDIYYAYSSNSGATWSSPTTIPGCTGVIVSGIQSNSGYGQGPTPVVASYFVIEQGTPSSFLVVFAAQDGLHYTTSKSGQNNWLPPPTSVVPGTYSDPEDMESTIWHPSLAAYSPSSSNKVFLIYSDKANGVYSQRYVSDPGTEDWDSSPVLVDLSSDYNMSPSLAIDGSGNPIASWSSYNSSLGKYTQRYIQGLSSGQWTSNKYEWQNISTNIFYPSIAYFYYSGQQYPDQTAIVSWGSDWISREMRRIGQSWNTTRYLAGASFSPNISREFQGSGIPLEEYTDQSNSPYSICQIDLGGPQKTAVPTQRIERVAVIYNKADRSILRLQLSQPVFTTASGDSIPTDLQFKKFDSSPAPIPSSAKVFDGLETEIVQVPSSAASISIKATVSIDLPDTLPNGSINKNTTSSFSGFTFGITANGEKVASLLFNQSFTNPMSSRHYKMSVPFMIPIQNLRGQSIALLPAGRLLGKFDESNLFCSVVNAIVGESTSQEPAAPTSGSQQLAANIVLGQNYPNPFNPMTTISYRVMHAGHVILKIYDELGREVAAPMNGDQPEGVYSVKFDASRLASGIYFYQLIAPGVNETKKMLVTK